MAAMCGATGAAFALLCGSVCKIRIHGKPGRREDLILLLDRHVTMGARQRWSPPETSIAASLPSREVPA